MMNIKVNYILIIQLENEKPETIKKYKQEIKDIILHNLPLKKQIWQFL